jgi:hypothetical protein
MTDCYARIEELIANTIKIKHTMIIETLKTLFKKDLEKLRTEIELYQHEDRIWHFEKNIANSGGNLCLHLIGNLNAYIGLDLQKQIISASVILNSH